MPAMTKFSVWETDTRILIDQMCAIIDSSSDDLKASMTDWFYSTGIEVFSKSQGVVYSKYTEDYKLEHGVRPKISAERIILNKKAGFDALEKEIFKKFANDNDELKNQLAVVYADYVTKGLAHVEFFTLQADVSTQLNQLANADPAWDSRSPKIGKLMADMYVAGMLAKPHLAAMVDDQLLLQHEYVAYLTEKSKIAPAGSRSALFAVNSGSEASQQPAAAVMASSEAANPGSTVASTLHR